jgi:hypothetical protein
MKTMSTITKEQQQAIADFLKGRDIQSGIGTTEATCSIASMNLALSGELTDRIPDCMSKVIGKWIIRIQDTMPDYIRNSGRWRALLPLACGTGRDKEDQRLVIIFDWAWTVTLPSLQEIADKYGFGDVWWVMCQEKTSAAAYAAAEAADAYAASVAAYAADAARAVVRAADAYAAYAADAAAYAADVAPYAADAADDAARVAAYVARVVARASADAARVADAAVWQRFDPCGLLQKLIDC